jgi:WD40 repeat protein
VALAGSNPAAGVPQSAGGYYFPDTIVYLSGGSVFAVNETGAGVLTIGTGTASRSSNGLYVATTAGQIIRPDGAAVGSASGLGTAPAWTRDGSVAYWGSGPNLIRYQGGTTSTAASLNGNINAVAFSPDGGTLLFASPQEIKLQYGDGNIGSIWQSGGESITLGPVWAVRGDRVGVYAVLSDGRRVFLSGDMTVLDNPNETLQVISPIQPGARVYLRSEDVGAQRLVAVWPGLPDREFTAISLLHVSWSPDGSQLVYGAPNGGLIWLDVATGEARVLVVGDARFPIWSPPLFSVQL